MNNMKVFYLKLDEFSCFGKDLRFEMENVLTLFFFDLGYILVSPRQSATLEKEAIIQNVRNLFLIGDIVTKIFSEAPHFCFS